MKNKPPSGSAKDHAIARDLERAGIEVVRLAKPAGEIPSRVRGKLGPIVIVRGIDCWIADGPLPVAVAAELYEHPVGRRYVRIAGRFESPPPEGPWVAWYTALGERIYPNSYFSSSRKMSDQWMQLFRITPMVRFHARPAELGATGYIELYHIDTVNGLQLFRDVLCAHRVNELARPVWWDRYASALSSEPEAKAVTAIVDMIPDAFSQWDADTERMPMHDNDDD